MLSRFLLIPLPVAGVLLLLQTQMYFGLDVLALLVAAPAYLLEEQVPYGLGMVSGESAKAVSWGVLGVALLGWSSMVLCPWWAASQGKPALRDKLMIIFLPLCALIHVGTIGWYIWNWTT